MTRIISSLLIFYFGVSSLVWAQQKPSPEQMATIEAMVDAYNQQDYKKMKKPWGLLGKVLVTKKRLRKEYEPYFRKYEKVEIDTVVCSSIYMCKALLSYEKDRYKRGYLQFVFNDKARLEGFGNGYPMLIYPNKEFPATGKLSSLEKTALIDSIITKRHRLNYPYDFNGCVLATDGDSVVYKNCFGNAEFELNSKLNDSTRFLLASCSKQFTAMGIMILSEQGKLAINDDITQFFPELNYKGISVEHLLTHTSGLPDYMPLLKKHWEKSKIATNRDVLEILADKQPDLLFSPGTKFKYSNTGYVILASIIEKVSRQSYGRFLQENVFEPLGMHQTIVVARRKSDTLLSNYAYGYVYSHSDGGYHLPDSLEEYDYVIYQDGITGDDGVSSSIHDLAIWTNALRENKLISEKLWQKARMPHGLKNGQTVNYGYGFFVEKGKAVKDLVYHTGGWPGYTTIIMQFSHSGETLIILSNNSYDRFVHLADEIAGILIYR